jgi:CheY-like chemotaxis protein
MVNTKTKEVVMNNTCEARDDAGHTNWFTRFFSRPVTETSAATPAPRPMQKKKSANQPVILIVDDDPLFLKIAAVRLETEGYYIITAKDGTEAIETVRKQKPHLVVLDVNLPQDFSSVPWDGFRLIAWMKRFESLKHIPVVMITSGDPSKYAREAIRAGAKAFYHKRMDQNHLVTMVKQSLGRCQVSAIIGDDPNFQI